MLQIYDHKYLYIFNTDILLIYLTVLVIFISIDFSIVDVSVKSNMWIVIRIRIQANQFQGINNFDKLDSCEFKENSM